MRRSESAPALVGGRVAVPRQYRSMRPSQGQERGTAPTASGSLQVAVGHPMARHAVRPREHPSFTGQSLSRATAELLGGAGRELRTKRSLLAGLAEGGIRRTPSRIRRTPKGKCRLSDDLDEERSDDRVVVAAWRATGSPTATRSDPLDDWSRATLVTLRPAGRPMPEQCHALDLATGAPNDIGAAAKDPCVQVLRCAQDDAYGTITGFPSTSTIWIGAIPVALSAPSIVARSPTITRFR
jgi:hypothetical protein